MRRSTNLDVYLVGFHPMRDDPAKQMEAHHFCRVVNEELMQCALFDGNTRTANLTGIEFIIAERLFRPCRGRSGSTGIRTTAEILSGQLVAPGIPAAAEHALMASKMNSYGKTWHVWDTAAGSACRSARRTCAWSFNREGEARPGLVEARDRRMGIDTAERRRRGRTCGRWRIRRRASMRCAAASAGRPSRSPGSRRRDSPR